MSEAASKVWIVMQINFNGEYDVETPYRVYTDESKALDFVTTENAKRKSVYQTKYRLFDESFSVIG